MLTVSGVTFEAAMMRSPSFSRFSSSVTMISLPAAMSAIADSTASKGGRTEAVMAKSGRAPSRSASGLSIVAERLPVPMEAKRPPPEILLPEIDRVVLAHDRIGALGRRLEERDEQFEIVGRPDVL